VSSDPGYDVVIRGGTIYDGGGAPPFVGDVALRGDSLVAVGPSIDGRGRTELDARGRAIAPGFINMLSHAAESLIADGRSQSDIRQGVTVEIFGEGASLGPLNDAMRRERRERQGDIRYAIDWTTLDEGLRSLVRRGVACNVASFVGATSLRIHELGHADRPPTAAELDRMRGLLREAMQDGALGVGSALGYAPACFAATDELVALAEVAPSTAACTSPICAARAAGSWRRSTSCWRSRAVRARRPRSGTSRRRGRPTGTGWTRPSSGSRPRAPGDSASPPTCTPIARRRPAWTRPCPAGSRKLAAFRWWRGHGVAAGDHPAVSGWGADR
jgi:hypothetical protein